MTTQGVIRICAAVITRADGMMVLVRKQGTSTFMQPGGKIEPGEEPAIALCRELWEELRIMIAPDALRYLGRFDAPAANEPDHRVDAELFAVEIAQEASCASEIAELVWIDPNAPCALPLAPLTTEHVLPRLDSGESIDHHRIMSYTLPVRARRIIHTIHGVADIDSSRQQYQNVLGGIAFCEGYEPTADRDMALIYVADHMVEPMAPRNADNLDASFAKWLNRYGEGFHSFEIKVDDAQAAAASLKEAGCTLIQPPYPVFFFVRAESTGGILLEVCQVPMFNDPKDRRNWNPGWAEGLPCGLLRLDHIACVVKDVDICLNFFTQKIDGELLSDERILAPQPGRRAMVRIGDTQVAFIAPDDSSSGALGDFLAKPNSGIYALVWTVEDEARARADFEGKTLGVVTDGCVGGAFAIDPSDFRGARHEFKVAQ